METGELRLRAARTERKLWLASFHQDATIARSNAAILLRSAPPSHQSAPGPSCTSPLRKNAPKALNSRRAARIHETRT